MLTAILTLLSRLLTEPVVEVGDDALDRPRRPQCPLRGIGVALMSEQRTNAVEFDIAQRAAGGADGVADALDIQRQHVEQILRQVVAGQVGAIAEVAEQHDDLAFAAASRRRGPVDRPRGANQRHDRNIALRPQLAGQANVRRGADAAERGLLVVGRRRTKLLAIRHPHPAGRAARPATAHGGMRQVEAPARLQHRPPPGHPHGLPGIRQRNEALAAPLDQIANLACNKSSADDGEIPVEEIVLPLRDSQPLHGVVRIQVFQRCRRCCRTGSKLFPHGEKAESREHRQQQRRGKKHRSKLPIPPAPAEREMQTETAVQPSRRHQAELPALRTRRPKIGNHTGVIRREPEHFIGEARRRRVTDQQDRHRKAEHDAQQFQRWQAEGAPLIDRDQRHHEMSGERAVEQNGARPAVPDLDRDRHSRFSGIERDQAERVIEEMRSDVCKQNEAGNHPQVPAPRTEEPLREQLLAPGTCVLIVAGYSQPATADANVSHE